MRRSPDLLAAVLADHVIAHPKQRVLCCACQHLSAA